MLIFEQNIACRFPALVTGGYGALHPADVPSKCILVLHSAFCILLAKNILGFLLHSLSLSNYHMCSRAFLFAIFCGFIPITGYKYYRQSLLHLFEIILFHEKIDIGYSVVAIELLVKINHPVKYCHHITAAKH